MSRSLYPRRRILGMRRVGSEVGKWNAKMKVHPGMFMKTKEGRKTTVGFASSVQAG